MIVNRHERVGGMPGTVDGADAESHGSRAFRVLSTDSDVTESLPVATATIVGVDSVVVQMLNDGSHAGVHPTNRSARRENERMIA